MRLELARKTVDRELAKLEQATAKLPDPPGGTEAAEIRAYVRALPDALARRRFLEQAVAEGDVATIASVLHRRPYLSGLSTGEVAELKAAWYRHPARPPKSPGGRRS